MRNPVSRSFCTCLLLLALAELLLRAYLPPLSVAAFEYGFSKDSGFTETADGMVHLTPGPTRDFFAQSFARQRPPGVYRIFTLGDSVEYYDAPGSHFQSNTYPALLAAKLTERGIPAENINLAVVGYGTLRNEVLLRKVIEYQPDLIILKLNLINEGPDRQREERAFEFKSRLPQNWIWHSYLVQMGLQLKETRLMCHTLPQSLIWAANEHPGATTPTDQNPFSLRSQQAINDCLGLCQSRHIPMLLLTQAFVADMQNGPQVIDHGLDAFARTLIGPDVRTVSFSSLLANQPIPATFNDHVHLSRSAHLLIAERLAEMLAQPR